MQVRVTILVENTTPVPNLIGEYGFACLITVDDRSLLFDTGSSQALFYNCQALGIKLEEIEEVVISHGHFDHTGALLPLLERYGKKKIYAHTRFLLPRLFPLNNGKLKKIGSPFNHEQLQRAGAELVGIDEFTEIWPGVYLSGEIPRNNNFEDTGGDFKVEKNGQIQDDKLEDDMALIIDHPEGLIIISGCAHSGIINTISHALRMTGKNRILAYIGGTHLFNASAQRIDQTAAALKSFAIKKLIVAHCTGFHASARLYNELGDMVSKGETGMIFKF
ncbi:MAG: MBL fold metallo-hydrolase [Syntrophomonadaceae bacterium]|nr:MBL fold metallo-hydrolase [Syntrophomonadaceae bacterium]